MTSVRPFNRAQLLVTFAHIASCGSISNAARHLQMDKAAVSRQLRDLETILAARLVHRSNRGLVLTEVGLQIQGRAERILHEMEHAEADAQALRGQPRGTLSVSTCMAIGSKQLVPLIADFMKRYPDVDLRLRLHERVEEAADPVAEGADVLLRICESPPEYLVAHRLCEVPYVVVASPARLQAGPAAQVPQDLQEVCCLFSGFDRRDGQWHFSFEGQALDIQVQGAISANCSEAVRALALQGLGIALLPCFVVADDLRSGALVRLFGEHLVRKSAPRSLFALHLPGRDASPKIKAFVGYVREKWLSDAPVAQA